MVFFRNRKKELEAEIARLEAFLSAMPGAYCGWSAQGEVAYSPGFCDILEIPSIKDEYDIYNALIPTDAAALEGHFTALRHKGTEFSYEARTTNKEKVLRFSGKRGRNLELNVSYDILNIEDITKISLEKMELEDTKEQVSEKEQMLRITLDGVPMPIWKMHLDGELVWVNRYYAEILGSTRERVLDQQTFISFGSIKDKDNSKIRALPLLELSQKAIDTGEVQYQENHAVVDGKRRLLRVVITPIEGMSCTIGMAKDITRQEEVETEFKHFQQNTNVLLQQMQTAIASFRSDETLEYYNPEYARLWDLQESWLEKHPKLGEIMERLRETRRLPDQSDFKAFKQSWLRMFTDLLDTKEELMYLPDGKTLRNVFIPRPAGGLIITSEDVTGELELESKYNTLMAVQKMSFDNLAEGVAVFGGDGRLKLYNPIYQKIWQIHPEDLEGEPHITKLVEKKKHKFHAQNWEDAKQMLLRQALDRTSREEDIVLKDGETITIYTVPLPDGGMMISYEDITAQIQIENALREKNAALEAADRLKLDFLANVSYQLRTPLNAIMGFAEILANQYFGTLNERQTEYAQGINDAGRKLLSLIDDILDLSTIEAGYLELHTDTILVKSMIENVYNLTQEWARKESVRVSLDCSKTIGQIVGDERRLKQVLLSLIRNAIQFTPEEGKITITAKRRKDNYIAIAVSDTGPGIPEEEKEMIFKPFERGAGAKQSNDGVGLGLSLVKNIIELHGGSIEVESALGKGTTFTLIIPPEVAAAEIENEDEKILHAL